MKQKYRAKKPKKGIGAMSVIIIAILSSITSVCLYDMYARVDVNYGSINNGAVRMSTDIDKSEEDANQNIEDIIEHASKAIVGVSKIKDNGSSIFLKGSTEQLGMGTGVIVSENGYIVTNNHVAGNKYSKCYITLGSGEVCNGNVVWSDKDIDLAIVKIDKRGLSFIALGNSDKMRTGGIVYAIGNPIGFEFQKTVTAGIISAVNRTIKIEEEGRETYMEDLIQTDATINPGNSGGALINARGEMIGINTVKITSAEGIGFAIPINIVKPIINKFVRTNNFDEPYIGIFAYDEEVIPYLDSKIKLDKGIYVASISLDGPCIKANLKVGDVITAIDGITINRMCDLRSYIYTKEPGQEVELTVNRNNKEHSIKIKLGKRI